MPSKTQEILELVMHTEYFKLDTECTLTGEGNKWVRGWVNMSTNIT